MDRDVVEAVVLGGVQLQWLRARGEDAGHFVVVGDLERGPYTRKEATLVFDAMHTALLIAGQQQSARLRRLVTRRT